MNNTIKPIIDWYTELSERDGILFISLYDKVASKDGRLEYDNSSTNLSYVIGYYESVQMLYDGIRTLLPDDNIYFHTGEFRYSWMRTKDNFLEGSFFYFARRKYERLLKEEFEKDKIRLVDDRFNDGFTYSIGSNKELLEKYYDHSANWNNYIFSARNKDLSPSDLHQIDFRTFGYLLFSPSEISRKEHASIKTLVNSYPFFCCSFEGTIVVATILYSKADAIHRLRKVAKSYDLALHVDEFFSDNRNQHES